MSIPDIIDAESHSSALQWLTKEEQPDEEFDNDFSGAQAASSANELEEDADAYADTGFDPNDTYWTAPNDTYWTQSTQWQHWRETGEWVEEESATAGTFGGPLTEKDDNAETAAARLLREFEQTDNEDPPTASRPQEIPEHIRAFIDSHPASVPQNSWKPEL